MKSFIQLLLLCVLSLSASAQIVINEISYNPPESGTDSLEYIEIYNAGPDEVDISGYHFAQGVEDTVERGTILGPQEYYLFSVNATALQTVMNVSSDQWSAGALRNGGEVIELNDAIGNMVDIVEYSDMGDWPGFGEGTDGEGASIVLCDPTLDNNNGKNWRASTNDLGLSLNDKSIFGSPGAENQTACIIEPDAVVESLGNNTFAPADITINVGETVRWVNVSGFHNVNGEKTTYPDNPEGFGNGDASNDAWTYDYTFNIAGVYQYQCDPHVNLGMTGIVTVMPDMSDDIPVYEIGAVTTLDGDGLPDSLNVNCAIKGIVHTPNFRVSNNGLLFTIIDDSNNGIGVFSDSDNLGYTVTEGDEIIVLGTISHFRGLAQIVASSISIVGTKPLFDPTPVTVLDESTESQLVVIEGLSYVDASEWSAGGSGFNINMTDGNNTYVVRIDNDTDIFREQSPITCPGSIALVGVGGQFSVPNEPPYNSGYQIFPRYISDFMCTTSITELSDDDLKLFPNPSYETIYLLGRLDYQRYMISDMNGKILSQGGYTNRIDVSEYSPGLYSLLIKVEDGQWKSKRFIKG